MRALRLSRGLQITDTPMLIAAFGDRMRGVPAGYVLGFVFDLKGLGVWLGLVAGLSAVGIMLFIRFWGHAVKRKDLLEAK